MSSDSLSVPGTEMLRMCGARGAPRPWIDGVGDLARGAPPRAGRAIAERAPLLVALGDGELGGAREADRRRDVLGARATAAVLRAAEKQRLERRAAAHVQRADPLGRADLVAGDGEEVEGNRLARRSSTLPNACTASVWKSAPCAFARRGELGDRLDRCRSRCSPTSRRRWRRRRRAASSNDASSTTPLRVIVDDPLVARLPRAAWCTAASTALCSIGVVTIALRPSPRRARQAPRMARLSPSVPPEVKQISSAVAPRQRATRSRASSSAVRASRPQRWVLRRIPEARPEERLHRFEDFGAHRRGGRVVEIDGLRHGLKYRSVAAAAGRTCRHPDAERSPSVDGPVSSACPCAEKLRSHRPERREEPLVDRAHEVARAERAAGAAGRAVRSRARPAARA